MRSWRNSSDVSEITWFLVTPGHNHVLLVTSGNTKVSWHHIEQSLALYRALRWNSISKYLNLPSPFLMTVGYESSTRYSLISRRPSEPYIRGFVRIMYQILIWWDTNWRNLHHLAWKEMHQVMEKKRWGKKKWVLNEIKRSWDIIWSRQRERDISSQSVSQADRKANRQDKETNHIGHGRLPTNYESFIFCCGKDICWLGNFRLSSGVTEVVAWLFKTVFGRLSAVTWLWCCQMWPAVHTWLWPGVTRNHVISLT